MEIMDIIVFGKPVGKALLGFSPFRRLNNIIASFLFLLASASSWAGTITIGQTSVQTTADGGNANLLLAQSATLSQTATIQSMSFYVTAAAGKLVLGIYDNTGTGGSPGKLLASTGAFTPKVGWNTQPVTSPVALATGTYWLAYFPNDNGLSFVVGHTGKYSADPTTFSGSMPSKFTQASAANWSWSLYATLVTPTPTITIGQTSVQTTADGGNANLLLAQTATLSQTATMQTMSFYVSAAAGELVLGIYDSVNGAPGQLLASTGAFTPKVGWNTQPVTNPVALASGTYWLAYFPSDSRLSFFIGQGAGKWVGKTVTFSPSMPNTFVQATVAGAGGWSFYAALTPGGTPAPSPTPAPTPTPTPTPAPTPTPSPTPVSRTGFKYSGGVFNLPSSTLSGYINNPNNTFTQPSSDAIYAMILNISTFNWTALDNAMGLCRANHLHFIWYCGFQQWAEGQNFPANYGITGASVKTMFTNLISQAAARYPDLATYCIFNYENEGLFSNGSGNWESAFGGAGSTGVDWIINTGKVIRQYVPNAQIGINDYKYEVPEGVYMSAYNQSSIANTALARIPALVSAGVLDWIGMEGYGLEDQTSANLTAGLNNVGSKGVKVIYTEFSPGSYWWFWLAGTSSDPAQNANATWSDGGTSPGGSHQSNQIAAWKRLFTLLSSNPNCIGITGPWVGTPAGGAPIFSGGSDTPTMTWIKSYIPTILGK